MEPIFNIGKEDIEPTSVLNIKEGQTKDIKVTLKLPMWMKIKNSSHFEDAKRGETLVVIRALLNKE